MEKRFSLGNTDVIKNNFLLKKKLFQKKNIHFVAISKWLEKTALSSDLLKQKKIYQIYNCVDEKSFFKEDMLKLRNELNLPINKKIILFGSQKLDDPIKNNDKINTLIKILDENNFQFIAFGKKKINNPKIKNFGFIKNNLLRQLYSSADVYISFSKQEAFGKTLVESLMCGTPVVCNDNISSREIILHKKNGFIVKDDDFQGGISWTLENLNKRNNYEFIDYTKKFTTFEIAKEYLNLYKNILNEKKN